MKRGLWGAQGGPRGACGGRLTGRVGVSAPGVGPGLPECGPELRPVLVPEPRPGGGEGPPRLRGRRGVDAVHSRAGGASSRSRSPCGWARLAARLAAGDRRGAEGGAVGTVGRTFRLSAAPASPGARVCPPSARARVTECVRVRARVVGALFGAGAAVPWQRPVHPPPPAARWPPARGRLPPRDPPTPALFALFIISSRVSCAWWEWVCRPGGGGENRSGGGGLPQVRDSGVSRGMGEAREVHG